MCIRDSHKDAQEIQAHHDQCGILREEGHRKQAVDRELGRAAHKWREQDGHFAVPLRGQRAACHHTGDRAAKADEHGLSLIHISMELQIHGYELTLRLDDAARIEITPAEAPAAAPPSGRPSVPELLRVLPPG